jgi:hypothetical protein
VTGYDLSRIIFAVLRGSHDLRWDVSHDSRVNWDDVWTAIRQLGRECRRGEPPTPTKTRPPTSTKTATKTAVPATATKSPLPPTPTKTLAPATATRTPHATETATPFPD